MRTEEATRTAETVAALARLMEQERELFESFSEQESSLTQVVHDRDWALLERCLGALERLAAEIDAVERARHEAYQELRHTLGVSERASFALVCSRLPEAERCALQSGHERLRASVTRARSLTASLGYYFRYIKESVEQILAEVLPHHRGRLYSRAGRPAQPSGAPVVIDRSL